MNTDEARAMLAAAKKAGVVHLVGNEFRWLPERALVALALAEGLIGEPRFMTLAQYVPLVADPEAKMPRWWFDADAGGGWLGASGSHLIDLVRTWLGEFDTLSAILPTVSERRRGAEDSFVLRFRMDNGAEGVLQNTAAAWGPSASLSRVAGTRGTLWIEGAKVQIADRNGVRELKVGPDLELPPQPNGDPHKQSSSFEIGPYIRLCEAFRAGIDGRDLSGIVSPATFADGVACMEVMDAIRQSDQNNGSLVSVR
jgi:predicted dehydrogenase